MRRIFCFALATLLLMSAVSCGKTETSMLTSTSSAAEFIAERLGAVPEDVILGDSAVAASYGVDMSAFEDDGYIIRTDGEDTLVFGKTETGLDRAVRKYVKAVQNDTADTLSEVYHEGYRIERLTIAGYDISEYTIYYPETANENMKFAADELVRLVKKACGFELPVVVGEASAPAIELRHTDDPALDTDGYRYFVTEDGLVIEGAVERGCMNGVWRFLQNECGWDSLIFGDSYLQESDHVDIPVGIARSETPILAYFPQRDYTHPYDNERAIPNSVQNSYGTIAHACHGIGNYRFVDIDYDTEQVCYTSEEQYEEMYGNVEKYVAGIYGSPGFYEVDISHCDNGNFCMCDTCFEVFREEGGHSGAVVRHANRLSEDINAIYPGVVFKIFAYGGTNQPPKVTVPNEWVYITFCYDMNCSNHTLDGSDCTTKLKNNGRNNKDFDEWLRGWMELTDNIYIWEYSINQHLMDHTDINTLYDNMQYYRKMKVKGVYIESEFYGLGTKHLEKMLRAEINWNPDMTREEAEEVFCNMLKNEYGDGWEYIKEYVDQWALAQRLTTCFHCWAWDKQYFFYEDKFNTHFYKDRFDNFMELFDAAIYGADSTEHQNRIELLSCNMIYMGCYSSYFLAYIENDAERLAEFERRYALLFERLPKGGFDPKNLPTISWAYAIALSDTAAEEAWTYWYNRYERLTGQPLPENAPVVSE